MRLKDFLTFKRIMGLTTSPNDAEALSAIRKANALLMAENTTWERVLDRMVKVESHVEAAPDDDVPRAHRALRDDEVEGLFAVALDDARAAAGELSARTVQIRVRAGAAGLSASCALAGPPDRITAFGAKSSSSASTLS